MTVELCLFRHGRTVWNAAGRYQGRADIDLDDLGRAQGEAVAERCEEISPAAVYSSDLKRCADVAEMAAARLQLEVHRDERLRERDVGTWSGLTREEVSGQFPQDFDRWINGDESVRPGGGESIGDVAERIESFLSTLNETAVEGKVVVLTHAAWVRTLMQMVLGPSAARSNLGVPSPGSLTVVRMFDDGARKLEAFNDRGHLLNVEAIDRMAPSPAVY